MERTSSVLKFRSDQNAPAHGSEPLSFPALVGQRVGIWRVVAEKCTKRYGFVQNFYGLNQTSFKELYGNEPFIILSIF